MNENFPPVYLLIFLLGCILGAIAIWIYQYFTLNGVKQVAARIIQNAEYRADELKRAQELDLKQRQLEQQKEFESISQFEKRKMQKEEERFKLREDKLETRMNLVEKKTF